MVCPGLQATLAWSAMVMPEADEFLLLWPRLSIKTEEVPICAVRSKYQLDIGSKVGSAMDERWLSVDEIAAHLGVSRDTVYKWITRKHLPAHKVGKLWKFSTKEVDEWVRSGGASESGRANAASNKGGAKA
jgi:excisionase family DNA binding protein